MRIVLKNFRLVDEETDTPGTVIIENGIISSVLPSSPRETAEDNAALTLDGSHLADNGLPVLMPAFVDLHAHFRDPGFPSKETPALSEVLESASLAAAAGGFATVVCMANTRPVTDTIKQAAAIKSRSDALGLIDLYPVISLTKGMEGKALSEISVLNRTLNPLKSSDGNKSGLYIPLMLSEDGKDLANDALFLAAMREAKRLGIPISCHCDFGGGEAEAARKAGLPRSVWSRIEENNATRRVIELGKKTGCHIHIAHVSTKEAVEIIRSAKTTLTADSSGNNGFTLTCEVMPHNLRLTEETANKLGAESWGRVNPPLRHDDDREALIRALADGTIDAIATDHAPHNNADKESGAPGFSAFETAFAAALTELVRGAGSKLDLKRLSSLMSANPARLVNLGDRGRLLPGMRADLVIADTERAWFVDPETFKTRGKNSPFKGMELFGKILMTIRGGRVVFDAGSRPSVLQ